jgi:hypothetical protein
MVLTGPDGWVELIDEGFCEVADIRAAAEALNEAFASQGVERA